jgi:hypothetical protein
VARPPQPPPGFRPPAAGNQQPDDSTGRTILGPPIFDRFDDEVEEEEELQPPEESQDQELVLKLDPAKISEYRQMLIDLFVMYGPTACSVNLETIKSSDDPVAASIEQTWTRAVFSIYKELSFAGDQDVIEYLSKMGIRDAIAELLFALGCHEIGHWEFPSGSGNGCPFDRANYYAFMYGPIFEVFKASGKFDESECKYWANREANAVADIIDNFNVSNQLQRIGRTYAGKKLYWYLQGRRSQNKKAEQDEQDGQDVPVKPFGNEYALFVKMNLSLIGDAEGHDLGLLGKFLPKHDATLDDAARQLFELFRPDEILDWDEGKRGGQWKKFAEAYAQRVLQFIDPKAIPQQKFSPRDAGMKMKPPGGQKQDGGGKQKKKQGRGKGSEEEDKQDAPEEGPGESPGEADEEDTPNQGEPSNDEEGAGGKGKGKDQEPDEPDDVQPGSELDRGEVRKMLERNPLKPNEDIPDYIDRVLARRAYYELRASQIEITADEGDLPDASFPLVPLEAEPFNPYRHDPFKLDPRKLVIDRTTGQMRPAVVTRRLPIRVPLKQEQTGLPDCFFLLLDSSSSMMNRWWLNLPEDDADQRWGWGWGFNNEKNMRKLLPWGEGSNYDYGLLTFFGHLHFFQLKKIDHLVRISAGIFSHVTLTAEGRDAAIDLMLNPVTIGSSIDMEKVIEMLQRASLAGKPAIFPLISDGEITNWRMIKDRFIAVARLHGFYMIQIGEESDTSRDLKNAGFPVYYVTDAKDIVHLAVNLTARGYAKAIAQQRDRMRGRMRCGDVQ